jgi:hypothetical protein
LLNPQFLDQLLIQGRYLINVSGVNKLKKRGDDLDPELFKRFSGYLPTEEIPLILDKINDYFQKSALCFLSRAE